MSGRHCPIRILSDGNIFLDRYRYNILKEQFRIFSLKISTPEEESSDIGLEGLADWPQILLKFGCRYNGNRRSCLINKSKVKYCLRLETVNFR